MPVPSAAAASAAARCQLSANGILAAQRTINVPAPFAVPPDIVHPVVLAERRGDITSVMLGDVGTKAVCIDTETAAVANPTPAQPLGPGRNLSVHDDGVTSGRRCVDPSHDTGPSHPPCTMTNTGPISSMDGQVTSTASQVRIRLIDGRNVEASIGGGFFFAWWPSSSRAASVTASAPDGTVLRACQLIDRSSDCRTP